MGLKCLNRISKWIWETEKGLEWETRVREMGFAISLACCEAGACHYLSKTLSYLEPFESAFPPGPPCLGRFHWPKSPGCPRGPQLCWAGDLPGAERGWAMQGAAQRQLGDLSVGRKGPWTAACRVEGKWGELGWLWTWGMISWSPPRSWVGDPFCGHSKLQNTLLCPEMLLSYNFFWLFALLDGSLMHQCIFLNWVI